MTTFRVAVQAPKSIAVGLNVSYTVPADRVSRITVCLDASASSYFEEGTSYGPSGNAAGNSESFSFIADSGTVISSVRTLVPPAQGIGNSFSSTTMTVNGSNSKSVTCRAGIGTWVGAFAIWGSSANFGFYAEEYFG